jgi:Xaa-Pro aminopeptidase
VWLDQNTCNYSLFQHLNAEKLITDHSPIVIPKAIKNPVETQGFRNCSLRDGAALVEYFAWLSEQLSQGAQLTEWQAAQKLLEFRKLVEPLIIIFSENLELTHFSP